MTNAIEQKEILNAIAALSTEIKSDLKVVKENVQQLTVQQARIEGKIEAVEAKIVAVEDKLIAVEDKLEAKIEAVEDKLSAKIETVEAKVEAVEDKLTAQIETVQGKLEGTTLMFSSIEGRVTNVENRLTIQGTRFFTFLGILITGLLAMLGKLVFFPTNFQ